MKILVLFSGFQGHYRGVQQLLCSMSLKEDIVYASHIGMPEEQRKKVKYLHLNAAPAFLDYEFIHHKDLKEIIKLKNEKVYFHRRKEALHTVNSGSGVENFISQKVTNQSSTRFMFSLCMESGQRLT